MKDAIYLVAVDLGASSGRVILGTLADERLSLTEVHRFENKSVWERESLRWDIEALDHQVVHGVELARERLGRVPPHGVSCDSWGVDYVLLNRDGDPVEKPFHYRDQRTEGSFGRVCERLGREFLFRETGVQFLPFNTIFQLSAESNESLRKTKHILMIADYFNHMLGGGLYGEATIASTTQMLDPRTRKWNLDVAGQIDMHHPAAQLLPQLVEPGTYLGDGEGFPVYASASHDTAAAVAGCPGKGDDWAFLSSGTWSLLGVELPAPVMTDEALKLNFSNELGVGGTTRLLKNIAGLWALQECRREWAAAGHDYSWEEIIAKADAARPFAAVIDVDDPRFMAPGDMAAKLAAFCRDTKQELPAEPGPIARALFEGLALKCRIVLDQLERVSGRTIRVINMVGGGTRNKLLCQLTADACGRKVVAGPAEATTVGNCLVQAIGVGAVKDLGACREIIRASFPLVTFDPHPSAAWDDACGKLKGMIP